MQRAKKRLIPLTTMLVCVLALGALGNIRTTTLKAFTKEEFAEIAKKLNDMAVMGGAMIPLVHRGDVSAHANSLLGVRINSWDSELWNIADWSRDGQ